MSARGWLRCRLAGWAYPEIARLDQALADEQRRCYRAQVRACGQEVRAALAEAQLDDERQRRVDAEVERNQWRLQARSVPLTVVDEDAERRVRHAEAEQTGGR